MQVLETIKYIGPNRRSGKCVIENLIELTGAEQAALLANAENHRAQVISALRSLGISADMGTPQDHINATDAPGLFAQLYAGTALAIQRAAGHQVRFSTIIGDPNTSRTRVIFEYEQSDVGQRADTLARTFLASVIQAIDGTDCGLDQSASLAELFDDFKEFARPFILPADAQAIIDAAAHLDIPCVKLDREPFQTVASDSRIRNNGLLKLGHSAYHLTLDGTLCVDRGKQLWPLLKDREQLFQTLTRLQVPVAPQDPDFRNCVNVRRAARSAAAIGYPVVVKPGLRSHSQGITLNIPDADTFRVAVEKAQQFGRKVMVEKHIAGRAFKVIVANGSIIGVVADGSSRDLSSEIHASTLRLVLDLADELDAGILVADIVSLEPGLPLDQTEGAVVDLEVAPELDRFLPAGSDLQSRAMTGLLRWLYPQGARSRIPLVAITGTNGKTTTCRMLAHVMQAAGFHTGLACTDGIYIDGEQVESGDRSGSAGHHVVLESRKVNLGVLETARGALAHSGLMFDWCNVSICLNISADHLGEYGVDTVEQMADLKRTVLEVAREAVVLNADDELCVGMLPFLSAQRIFLVSTNFGVEELTHISGGATGFSVLENIEGSDWLVLYDNGRRMPVIEAAQIPATYGGLAIFNVSNALHAVAACYLMGVELETVKDGICSFNMSFENTPGRLNFYDEHPFRVIMDFAHNTGSVGELCAFVDRLKISGSKFLMFQVRGDIEDKYITEIAAATAGHFDHYMCRTHPVYTGPDEQKVLALMKGALLDSGVTSDQITTTTDPTLAVETMLQMGSEGDLLVFAPGSGQREDTWHQIMSFQSESGH